MKHFLFAVLIICFWISCAYAQTDQASNNQDHQPASAAAPAATLIQPQEISIYGEVKLVNQPTSTMVVQYYDYDSDEEKTIDIAVDSGTKLENAALITDIKQGNWVDVIYIAAGGTNQAKSIIVEKEEEMPAVEMPKAEAAPKDEALLKQ